MDDATAWGLLLCLKQLFHALHLKSNRLCVPILQKLRLSLFELLHKRNGVLLDCFQKVYKTKIAYRACLDDDPSKLTDLKTNLLDISKFAFVSKNAKQILPVEIGLVFVVGPFLFLCF